MSVSNQSPSGPCRSRRFGTALLAALTLVGLVMLRAADPARAVPSPAGVPGTIQTMAGYTVNYQSGGYGPEGVPAAYSQFQNPRGLGFAMNGDVYIGDTLNHRVRRIDANGIVSLAAGGGAAGELNEPHGVAVDSHGNRYIADPRNCVIVKVNAASGRSPFAGTGRKNPDGTCARTVESDGNALEVGLDQPTSLFMQRVGNTDTLWIANTGNNLIQKIDVIVNGIEAGIVHNGTFTGNPQIVRVAGTNRSRYFGGDSGDALDAEFRHPQGVWVAADGTIYVSDGGNNLVRKIAMPAPGSPVRKVTTIAGDVAAATANANSAGDLPGNSDGDGGLARNAHLDEPRGITGDNQGRLYVAEEHGARVRRINLTNGMIDTIAGDGTFAEQRANGGSAVIKGENGPALETQFNHLRDIQMNPYDGSLWVADSRNNRVRAIVNPANAPGAIVPTGGGSSTPAPTTTTTRPSASATPPEAPATGSATGLVSTNRSVGVVALSWSAPSDGGSPVTSYQITATPGGQTIVIGAPGTSTLISDLQNGTAYTFTVRAQNAVGLGAPSAAIGPAVPYSHPAPVPGVTATVANGGAQIRWETPADDGGRPISGYRVSAEPAGPRSAAGERRAAATPLAVTVGANERAASITNLESGTRYAFSVVALNEAGASEVIPASTVTATVVRRSGYWMVGSDGVVHPFGDAKAYGNAATLSAVDLEPTPSGNGYWIVDADGRVFAFGDAVGRGDVDRSKLAAKEQVTSLSATSDGAGYWIFTDRGRVLTFGTAPFLGDVSALQLNGPVLDSIVTPSGRGYYMVASDGGIFAFGDALFYGSMGGRKLNAPVQSLVPDADGVGYWLVASDGGIFAFDAGFMGSLGSVKLNKPVTGMVRAGRGYLMVGEDGGIFDFSHTPDGFKGSLGANPPARPVTSVAVLER